MLPPSLAGAHSRAQQPGGALCLACEPTHPFRRWWRTRARCWQLCRRLAAASWPQQALTSKSRRGRPQESCCRPAGTTTALCRPWPSCRWPRATQHSSSTRRPAPRAGPAPHTGGAAPPLTQPAAPPAAARAPARCGRAARTAAFRCAQMQRGAAAWTQLTGGCSRWTAWQVRVHVRGHTCKRRLALVCVCHRCTRCVQRGGQLCLQQP